MDEETLKKAFSGPAVTKEELAELEEVLQSLLDAVRDLDYSIWQLSEKIQNLLNQRQV